MEFLLISQEAALHIATEIGNIDAVKFLLSHPNIDINIQTI